MYDLLNNYLIWVKKKKKKKIIHQWLSGLAKVNFGPRECVCNCILWSCFTGENRTKPMQFIPISVVPQTDSGGAKAHYITQRGETAEISEI